jgi:hypothetical protein
MLNKLVSTERAHMDRSGATCILTHVIVRLIIGIRFQWLVVGIYRVLLRIGLEIGTWQDHRRVINEIEK